MSDVVFLVNFHPSTANYHPSTVNTSNKILTMRPLNAAERNQAFRNFLLFFIITIAVIIAAVFFSIQVPFKENDQLKDKIAVTEKQRDFSEQFADKMETTIKLLDSVNLANVRAELIDGAIDDNLRNMQAMIKSDTLVPVKNLYTNVVENFYDLKNAKKQLRDASGKDATFGTLQADNANLHSQLQQANSQLQYYQSLVSSLQQQK